MTTHWMVPVALLLNLLILVPLCTALLNRSPGMDQSFGPETDARLILTSVYMAIAVVSAALLVALWTGAGWVLPAALALFAVQIVYKVTTAALLGIASPVVMTNLFVVAVQLATFAAVAASWRA
ncbi:MAG: hypothetical protein AAFY38_06325 [Pseudomonadota bacterium]